jgi:CMP/dCMP kinase
MAVITVARQLGSEGDRIAEQVAQGLGFEFIDRRLVEEIASITGATSNEVEKFDEKAEGRVKHFLKNLLVPEMGPGGFPLSSVAYFPEFGLEFPYVAEKDQNQEATYLDRGTYQLLITTLMQDFGSMGKVVIVGRASQVILAESPTALHIKIVAPFEERCQRIQTSRDMNPENARKLVEQHDEWRKLYLRNSHNADWDDPLLYDLTINTGKMGVEEAVKMVQWIMNERSN